MSYESKSSESGRTEADVRAVLGGKHIGQRRRYSAFRRGRGSQIYQRRRELRLHLRLRPVLLSRPHVLLVTTEYAKGTPYAKRL